MKAHDLPVYQEKDKILKCLEEHQVIIVESPTGSGKTTQIPLILHEAGYTSRGIVGVTQPRRIATLSVSEYIARQLNKSVPDTIGYKMRFEDRTDPSTRIKIMTDGILLQEMKNDTTLSSYSVIMVDEAHERSLNIDFILGLLKEALVKRPDLKVVISSATINTRIFSQYFNQAPIVEIDTPVYPVQVIYDPLPEKSDPDMLTAKIADITERINSDNDHGDVLVFLPGERAIKDAVNALNASKIGKKLWVIPLYGRLGKEEQQKVFIETPRNKTKVVVSTNIAETSVTIDGVTHVIDSGRAKLNYYSPRTFTSSLIEEPVSRASSNQRKGRAGRTQPGICYRIYSKKDFDIRKEFTPEEIYRTDLSEVVLRMAELGIRDFMSFDFISPPGKQGIQGAVEALRLLGALDNENYLTETGKKMTLFPLLPRHSRMIVEAIYRYPDVMEEVLIATAFISTNSPYLLPQGEEIEARKAHHSFRDPAGDFVSYLHLFRAFVAAKKKTDFCQKYYIDERSMREIVNIQGQLGEIVSNMEIPLISGGSTRHYLSAVSRGLIQFVCIASRRNTFRSLTAREILIHPGSVMFRESPRFFVAGEIVRTSRTYARSVSPLQKEWLKEIDPDLLSSLIEQETGRGERKKKQPPRSDFTNQIKIGGEIFEVARTKKRKKIVLLPWPTLQKVVHHAGKELFMRDFGGLKGVILYQSYDIMSGARLETILSAAKDFNLEQELSQKLPSGRSYDASKRPEILCKLLFRLMNLCFGKKKKKVIGFVCLQNDGIGRYWFKCERKYYTALNENLASLEALADDLDSRLPQEVWELLNATYRRIDDLLHF